MKKSLLFVFILLANFCWGQVTFQKTYGGSGEDQASVIQQTTDGGYFIAGESNSFGIGYQDIYLLKTDSTGDTLWTKTYGINNDHVYAAVQTSDGGYFISGSVSDSNDPDIFLMRTDASGDTLWIKFYQGTDFWARSAQQTGDGGFIIAGAVGFIMSLIKTDSSGNIIWARGYANASGNSCAQTTDGGYIITGYINTAQGTKIALIKTDANGDTLWTKNYGGLISDIGYCVRQTNDGGYIILAGTYSFGAGASDFYLIKTDGNGDTLWSKTYGEMYDDYGYDVRQTGDGGYIVAGGTFNFGAGDEDGYLIKTDANGDTLWTRAFGGTDFDVINSVIQTSDGGYALAGYKDHFGDSLTNAYVIKTDANGNTGCNQYGTVTIVGIPPTEITNTSPQVVNINPVPVSYSVASAGGAVVTVLCGPVGINANVNEGLINIYPNPVHGILNVECKMQNSELKIYDVTGRIVLEESLRSQLSTFSFQLDAGIYFIRVSAGEKMYQQKLVVE